MTNSIQRRSEIVAQNYQEENQNLFIQLPSEITLKIFQEVVSTYSLKNDTPKLNNIRLTNSFFNNWVILAINHRMAESICRIGAALPRNPFSKALTVRDSIRLCNRNQLAELLKSSLVGRYSTLEQEDAAKKLVNFIFETDIDLISEFNIFSNDFEKSVVVLFAQRLVELNMPLEEIKTLIESTLAPPRSSIRDCFYRRSDAYEMRVAVEKKAEVIAKIVLPLFFNEETQDQFKNFISMFDEETQCRIKSLLIEEILELCFENENLVPILDIMNSNLNHRTKFVHFVNYLRNMSKYNDIFNSAIFRTSESPLAIEAIFKALSKECLKQGELDLAIEMANRTHDREAIVIALMKHGFQEKAFSLLLEGHSRITEAIVREMLHNTSPSMCWAAVLNQSHVHLMPIQELFIACIEKYSTHNPFEDPFIFFNEIKLIDSLREKLIEALLNQEKVGLAAKFYIEKCEANHLPYETRIAIFERILKGYLLSDDIESLIQFKNNLKFKIPFDVYKNLVNDCLLVGDIKSAVEFLNQSNYRPDELVEKVLDGFISLGDIEGGTEFCKQQKKSTSLLKKFKKKLDESGKKS